jgi:sterol desaturase/sphingolipid hydroxylase (fatty acid hydroxylase superfamily)
MATITQSLHDAFTWYLDHTLVHWIFLAYAVLLGVELAVGRPQRAAWRDVGYNCIYLLTLLVAYAFSRPFAGNLAKSLSAHLGGPVFDLTFDAKGAVLPLIGAQLIFLFIYDFFYYWHHRLQHAVPAFWMTHKIHHMDENMGVTTAYKHHWSDDAARTVTILIPMALLFKLEPVTIFWIAYAAAWQGLLIHTNVPWTFGPLRYVITGPAVHRIHHSYAPEHRHCNFAAVFPVFDVMFGTYVDPPKQTLPTGLDTHEQIHSLWWGWMYPLREWYAMLTGPRAAKPSSVSAAE